ncbi:hypothetical protein POPTR_003G172651v4 [Populus trichocarpa]|uniref:Uncharacterized protein n=1 Tax=Populus trichocarpa TaxID=3694 RepID=A0ACC0T9T6_POPTR|nr:hypothetical protein POPTR_003G172651v4 [Populus trichocarpa]
METPIPCSAEEEHIFRSQHPAVPVPDITLNDFVLQDAELYADKVAFVEAVTGKTYICRGSRVPIIVLSEMCISTAMNWNELLDAADRSGDILACEEVHQSDLCALPFSSGTTGMSKGVMLTHRNLVANLCSSLFSEDPEMVGHVATLGLIPFFHIYGITGICCATLRNKGKVVVMGRTFLNALITQEVSFAPIVPPIGLQAQTAAAPLAPELLAAFENKFPGVQVQEAYGLTEHSCITLTHGDPSKGHGIAKKNSVGFLLPHLEIKLIDPETGRKEETGRSIDTDGWLRTGDIGFLDNDGDIFIVDRMKELIKYKGFQVRSNSLTFLFWTYCYARIIKQCPPWGNNARASFNIPKPPSGK